jgi:hypothetical protein
MGDQAALRESGWEAVERLLDQQIAPRSEELRERALRRRTRRVVHVLLERAMVDDDRQRAEASALSERRHAVGLAGATLERDPETALAKLTEALTEPDRALRQDLAQILIGRDTPAISSDPLVRRYVTDRTLEALAGPLATTLASLSGPAILAPSEILPVTRALLRGALASTNMNGPCLPIDGLSRAAIATLVDHLFLLSSNTPSPSRSGGIVRELEALEAALGGIAVGRAATVGA